MSLTDADPSPASAPQDEGADLALDEVLEWLRQTGAPDPLDELVPLRRHLRNVLGMTMPPLALLRILDLFEPRIARIHGMIFPLLLEASLPLPRTLRVVSQGVIELHGDLAAGFLRVVDHEVGEGFQRPKRRRNPLAARALSSLRQQYELTLRVASGIPQDFWLHVGRLLYDQLHAKSGDEDNQARFLLQYLLALHASQPEALTAREQAFLCRHIERLAGKVELAEAIPNRSSSWHWLDTQDRRAPTPVVRAPSPVASGIAFFSCHTLARKTQHALDELAAGRAPRDVGLSDRAAQAEYRNVLHHATRRWLNPPYRRHERKRGSYRIEVCPRLLSLWSILRGETMLGTTTEWQVMNDSPAGYAAMHVTGNMPNLLAGSVIGIRRNDKDPWSLCLVRWVRSENAEHLEVGLEVLSPNAQAVRVASPARPAGPVPALLLPPMNAAHRGETLLTERGVYDHGRIAILHESADNLQIVECQPQPLVMQTASIELFEFERIQHPAQWDIPAE